MVHLMQDVIGPAEPNMKIMFDGMTHPTLLTFALASRFVNLMFTMGLQNQVVVHLCDGREGCQCQPMRNGQSLDDLIK